MHLFKTPMRIQLDLLISSSFILEVNLIYYNVFYRHIFNAVSVMQISNKFLVLLQGFNKPTDQIYCVQRDLER